MCFRSLFFFFFKQKTAYEMRISDWSSDVCSSDLDAARDRAGAPARRRPAAQVPGQVPGHRTAAAAGRVQARHRPRRRHRDREDRPDAQAAAAVGRRTGAVRAVGGRAAQVVRMKRYPLHTLLRLREHRTDAARQVVLRSEEHTSELQSLMRISYAVFCLKKKK